MSKMIREFGQRLALSLLMYIYNRHKTIDCRNDKSRRDRSGRKRLQTTETTNLSKIHVWNDAEMLGQKTGRETYFWISLWFLWWLFYCYWTKLQRIWSLGINHLCMPYVCTLLNASFCCIYHVYISSVLLQLCICYPKFWLGCFFLSLIIFESPLVGIFCKEF